MSQGIVKNPNDIIETVVTYNPASEFVVNPIIEFEIPRTDITIPTGYSKLINVYGTTDAAWADCFVSGVLRTNSFAIFMATKRQANFSLNQDLQIHLIWGK